MSKTTVNHHLVVQWLEAVRAQLRTPTPREALDLGGIDVLDVLLSPLFMAAIMELRRHDGEPPRGAIGRLSEAIRQRGYRLKLALAERRACSESAAAQATDVLVWPRDIRQFAGQGPVSQALVDAGLRCDFLSCDPWVFRQLRDRGVRSVYSLRAWPGVLRAARHEARQRVRQVGTLARERLPLYRQDGFERDLSATYWSTVAQSLPAACKAVANARAALEAFSPKLVIVGNDKTTEGRAACLVARQQNIPTAVLHHGHSFGNPLNGLHRADRIVVYGDVHRRDLLSVGIEESRVLTCGAPYLDQRPRQTGKMHPDLARLLKPGPDQPYVLVATSGPGHTVSHHQHALVIEQLMGLSNRFPQVLFAVKLHRKDHVNYYRQVADRVGAHRLRIIPDATPEFPRDIFGWLQGCRAVLTGASTVAIEAMLMDVPVITMDFCDEIHDIDFIDIGATLHVTSGDQLDERLRDVLGQHEVIGHLRAKAAEYLQDSFFKLDGQSAKRTAEALAALLRGQTIEPARAEK